MSAGIAKETIFGVVGGLGLFIFGMSFLSDSLQKIAGTKLRRILRSLTKSKIRGVFLGTLVTSIIQSSSVTTVILAGLLNAGIINLMQAASVVIGANIGTTVTAQIIAFKISHYSLPAIAIGVALMLFARKKKIQLWGQVILSFGLIFLGLMTMSSVLKPLKDIPEVTEFFLKLSKSPVICVFLGTAFTVMIQSSSASIGMVISLASAGLLDFQTALFIVLGDNIGTTITAWLASIGGSISAKRMACFHTLFNIIGATYFFFLIKQGFYIRFIDTITPGPIQGAIERHIANSHTFFNVLNAVIFLPFTPYIIKLITKIIPGEEVYVSSDFKYLQDKLLSSPDIAIDSAKSEILFMAKLVKKTVINALEGFFNKDKKAIQYVQTQESAIDQLQHDITYYLAKLSSQNLTTELAEKLPRLIHTINDLERIADHGVNISELIERVYNGEIEFSNKALAEMRTMYASIEDMFDATLRVLEFDDQKAKERALKIEKEVNKMQKQYLAKHSQRLCNNECSPHSALIYVDFINNLEKIGDHLTNITLASSRDFAGSES